MILDYDRNFFLCPTFVSLDKVFNVLVNALHDVTSVQELHEALRVRGEHDMIARAVYEKYDKLVQNMYKYDLDGNIVEIDYDKEAFAI